MGDNMQITNVVLLHTFDNFNFDDFVKKLQNKDIEFKISSLNKYPVIEIRKDTMLFRVFKSGKVIVIITNVDNIDKLQKKIKIAEEFINSLNS